MRIWQVILLSFLSLLLGVAIYDIYDMAHNPEHPKPSPAHVKVSPCFAPCMTWVAADGTETVDIDGTAIMRGQRPLQCWYITYVDNKGNETTVQHVFRFTGSPLSIPSLPDGKRFPVVRVYVVSCEEGHNGNR